jgi:anti-sigma B factor antagonist
MRYNVAVTEARSTLRVDEVPDGPPGATVLAVSGELDLATISLLKDAVTEHLKQATHVVLDLSEMTFCDSTGLGAFVGLHRQAATNGAKISLAAPRRRIDDLLQLSGINQVVAVYPTRGEAVGGEA